MNIQGIKSIFQKPEFGLLFIRVSIGVLMIIYGFGKFAGGEETLKGVGSAISYMGIDVGEAAALTLFFGIMAAGSELVGGVLLVIGFFFRVGVAFLIGTMVVATLYLFSSSDGDLTKFGHPLLMLLVLFGLLWTGPGRLSIQKD